MDRLGLRVVDVVVVVAVVVVSALVLLLLLLLLLPSSNITLVTDATTAEHSPST